MRDMRSECGSDSDLRGLLNASTIVLIELSLQAPIDNFPADRGAMPIVVKRFNALFTTRWQWMAEFLKLHDVPSERGEPWWQAHRHPTTFPERLSDLLELWRQPPPSTYDVARAEEIFPAASYRYVDYGMGGTIPSNLPEPTPSPMSQFDQVKPRARTPLASLPASRCCLDVLNGGPLAGRQVPA